MYEKVFTIFISLLQIFSEYKTNIEKIWNYQADVAERNDRFLEINTFYIIPHLGWTVLDKICKAYQNPPSYVEYYELCIDITYTLTDFSFPMRKSY